MISYYKETPLGVLEVEISDKGVHRLQYAPDTILAGEADIDHPVARQLEQELNEYFAGSRREFSVPIVFPSGDFAQRVLSTLRDKVPSGATVFYSDLALAVGHPGAARAVGNVMHDNPILIILPCHRVLPKSGGIGRYAGREDRKAWFLEHEKRMG